MSRKAHIPDEQTRAQVSALASFGHTQAEICSYLRITSTTLRDNYRFELDNGLMRANAAVAAALYRRAINKDCLSAQIFWLKARAKWCEKDVENQNTAMSVAEKLIDRLAKKDGLLEEIAEDEEKDKEAKELKQAIKNAKKSRKK